MNKLSGPDHVDGGFCKISEKEKRWLILYTKMQMSEPLGQLRS